MKSTRPRGRRYAFAANIEIIDVGSEAKVTAHTSDIGLFGCRVSSAKTLPLGSRVRLRIVFNGAAFTATARVTYARNDGMGLAFITMHDKEELILEKWVSELRDATSESVSYDR